MPGEALRRTRAAMDSGAEEAAQIDQALGPLWTLFREFGSFRVMYAIADHLDGKGIEPMRPVKPLPTEVHERVGAALSCLKGSEAAQVDVNLEKPSSHAVLNDGFGLYIYRPADP
ncbi:hypothetical protein [Falsirhodobacter sp. 1013]|uniref:hypothetical protein n=1 Tax=Falsirhodobacter sp. 1013 TaxID=3417566 RepID=UPI003EC0FD3A